MHYVTPIEHYDKAHDDTRVEDRMIDKVKVGEGGRAPGRSDHRITLYLHTMLRYMYLVSVMIKNAFRMFDMAINVCWLK